MNLEDAQTAYNVLKALAERLREDANKAGTDGVPDEAATMVADAECLQAAAEILHVETQLRLGMVLS